MTGRRDLTPDITVTGGRLAKYDLFTGIPSADRSKEDSVDRNFKIVGATWSDSFDIATGKVGYRKFLGAEIIELDTNENLYGEITYTTDKDGNTATDVIQGHVDVANGYLNLTSLSGKLQSIKIRGYVSSESHDYATQVGIEMDKTQIQIGSAEHVEATMPIEFLQDVKAMYSIDGAATVVDQMSNMTQQKVDLNLIQFLEDQYEASNQLYHEKFDVFPQSDFALGPIEWQKQLRKLIDYTTQTMRADFKNYEARFVIIGNPVDTMLLDDVKWDFTTGEQEVNGVTVSYNVGVISDVATYRVVSSDLIQKGGLYIIAVPQRPDYKTFVYYPYTFNVVQNYNNSQNPSLPNIMMTKRYTTKAFTNIIAKIDILHNDGSVYHR